MTRVERSGLVACLAAALASVGAAFYAHAVVRDRSLQQATARAASLAATTARSPLLRTPASPAVSYWIAAQLRSLELADRSIASARLVGPAGETIARVDHGALVSPSVRARVPRHDQVVGTGAPGGRRIELYLARRAESSWVVQLPEGLALAALAFGAGAALLAARRHRSRSERDAWERLLVDLNEPGSSALLLVEMDGLGRYPVEFDELAAQAAVERLSELPGDLMIYELDRSRFAVRVSGPACESGLAEVTAAIGSTELAIDPACSSVLLPEEAETPSAALRLAEHRLELAKEARHAQLRRQMRLIA